MGSSAQITDMRCRSTLYTSLGRLLMIDLGEDEEKFLSFMSSLTGESISHSLFELPIDSTLDLNHEFEAAFDSLAQLLKSNSMFNVEEAKVCFSHSYYVLK